MLPPLKSDIGGDTYDKWHLTHGKREEPKKKTPNANSSGDKRVFHANSDLTVA